MKRGVRLLAVVAMAISLSGCWLQSGFGQNKDGNNSGESTITAANVDQLDVAWSADVGDSARESLTYGGSVYARSNGAVTALDLATGDQRWSKSAGPAGPYAGGGVPAILDGTLRVPVDGGNCSVVKLDLGTGDQLASQEFGAPILPPNWTFGCTTDDALTTSRGVFVPYKWTGEGGAPGGGCPGGFHWQRFDGVGVVDESNTIGWTGIQDSPGGCGSLPYTGPEFGQETAYGDHVLVVRRSTVSAHPLAGCPSPGIPCPSWSVDVGGAIVGPAVVLANGDIAVGRTDGTVVVISGSTHSVLWDTVPAAPLAAPLAATAGSIFVTRTDGTVDAYSTAWCGSHFCGSTWTASLPSPASARPSIGGEVLYVGSADGTVSAVRASDGTHLWSHATGSKITGAPTIDDGTLLVGSENGDVTAFTLGGN